MIKLLIVDDSALMRRQLMTLFQAEGDFEIRQARNGDEAVRENREFQPDVVTLDINMPEMDGLTALSLIMAETAGCGGHGLLAHQRGGPGHVRSTEPGRGGLRCQAWWNHFFVHRQNHGRTGGQGTKRRAGAAEGQASTGLVRRLQEERKKAAARAFCVQSCRGLADDGLLVIGASTGGPRALEIVLSGLPARLSLAGGGCAAHAGRVYQGLCRPAESVLCACKSSRQAARLPIEAGKVYIGRGGADTLLANRAGKLTVLPAPENPQFLWHPSVELLGRSVLQHYDPNADYGGAADRHGLRRIGRLH